MEDMYVWILRKGKKRLQSKENKKSLTALFPLREILDDKKRFGMLIHH
jgi:hypothetical protein